MTKKKRLTKPQLRKRFREVQEFLYDVSERYPKNSEHWKFLMDSYHALLMYRSRVDTDKQMQEWGYAGYEDLLDKVTK